MMPCPHCEKKLIKKTIHTVGAGKIEVDYCPNCGGIFFDQGEVNRISISEAEKLMQESKADSSYDHPTSNHECPRCGASLARFYGESVPEDVHVLRCPDCSGTWFESDELDKFKKAQEAKLNYYRTWKLPLPSLSAVLIPVALLITLTGVTLITVDQVQKGTYTDIKAREILSNPTVIIGEDQHSSTIVFATIEPARTTVTFWYDKPLGKMDLPVSEQLSTIHQVQINGLIPGKVYYYQIGVVTAEHSFTSEEFVFTLE